MTRIERQHIPLIALISLSAFWAWFYQSSTILNDYGQAHQEWWLLIDGLLVLPLLCLICIPERKTALIKAAAYAALMIVLGSLVIPEDEQLIWNELEKLRYLVLALFVILELSAVATVILAIRSALGQGQDPDRAIRAPIERLMGRGLLTEIFAFEARVWTFLLCARSIKQADYAGDQHFSYHRKDGVHSNMAGLIGLILIELPVVHVVLHLLVSGWFAGVVTALTLLGLVFLIAEYRAFTRRPISIDGNDLIIRYGLFSVRRISHEDIRLIERSSGSVRRKSNLRRYNSAGNPNVRIELPQSEPISHIYLGVDHPDRLIQAVLNSQGQPYDRHSKADE